MLIGFLTVLVIFCRAHATLSRYLPISTLDGGDVLDIDGEGVCETPQQLGDFTGIFIKRISDAVSLDEREVNLSTPEVSSRVSVPRFGCSFI